MSCLQLGFYLASWGMFRGSSTLLRRSARHYKPVIDVVAAAPAEVWDLDADRYSSGTWPVIRQLDQQIRRAFGHDNEVTSALATKVMLGVFGNIPAFDTRFRRGFRAATFGPKAFSRLGEFYQEHAGIIERHRISTLDFRTGHPTRRRYSRAKVIDMIFFIEGGAIRIHRSPDPEVRDHPGRRGQSSAVVPSAPARDQLGRGDRVARVGFNRTTPVQLARRELLANRVGVAVLVVPGQRGGPPWTASRSSGSVSAGRRGSRRGSAAGVDLVRRVVADTKPCAQCRLHRSSICTRAFLVPPSAVVRK